jgi:hypothetical protein
MTEHTQPGLYLVNATGEMIGVHTVSSDNDLQLLREYLEEWDIEGVEIND